MFTDYDKCSLLLPCSGANGGTTFTDWSVTPKTVTAVGNAQTSTANSKYYGSSGLFDGTGDYLSIPDHNDFSFGSGDFSIGCWFYPNAYPNADAGAYYSFKLLAKDSSPGREILLSIVGTASSLDTIYFYGFESDTVYQSVSSAIAMSLNAWYFISVVRDANKLYIGNNGTILNPGGTAFNPVIQNTTSILTVGASVYPTYPGACKGNIQDVIMIKGANIFGTTDFTPPTRLIGQISGNVKDAAGVVASRKIFAVPRSYPSKVYETTSDAGTGDYSIILPATEIVRVALANETSVYNDLCARIIPE